MPTETIATSAPVSRDAPLARFRYRLRFAKTGELRFVSHHDLMHVVERLMRRAELPFAVTQGFHPQPKMSFALSLALGVVGRNEVFDVELTRDLPADDVLSRMNRQAPAGLAFLSAVRLDKKPSSQVRRMFYRLVFRSVSERVAPPSPNGANGDHSPSPNGSNGETGRTGSLPTPPLPNGANGDHSPSPNGCNGPTPGEPGALATGGTLGHRVLPPVAHAPGSPGENDGQPLPNGDIGPLSERIAAFLAKTDHWVVRTRPQPRRINIRPFVADLSADDTGPDPTLSPTLSMILWVTPTGAARPEEIVQALGLGPALEAGAVLERTHLELLDEVPEHERFVPDISAISTAVSTAAATSAPADETPRSNDAPPEQRLPQPTSLLANPLSFDS